MALIPSGGFGRSGGISAAIGKYLRLINLKPVKKIVIKYDPFNENTRNIRDFNTLIFAKKVIKTNLSCLIKTEIASDRSESEVTFDLTSGQKFLFKCNNLTTLEILQQINKHITPLAPVEDTTGNQAAATAAPKSLKKKKK